MLAFHWIDQVFRSENWSYNHLLNCWNEMVLHRIALQTHVLSLRLAVLLEGRVTDLIAIFMCPIVLTCLLDRIVSQVGEHVIWIRRVDDVWLTWCSQVTFFEEVNSAVVVPEYPTSYVEFPSFYQKWSFNVLLDDEWVMSHCPSARSTTTCSTESWSHIGAAWLVILKLR